MPYAKNKGADQPAHPRSLFSVFVGRCSKSIIYWSKVLTDQQGLCRFFRKHKIVKNLKTATIKQVIIHLSNLQKMFFFLFFFFQKKSLCILFWSKMESTLLKYAPSISQLLIIPCIGHSRSHFLPLDLNGKKC